MKNIYSNPRTFAEFPDWPYGRRFKTLCTFEVEALEIAGDHKERVIKTTINPQTGKANKPKKTTFAVQARIVDGNDGKTYLIEQSKYGPTIYVKRWDFFDHESIRQGDDAERYAEVRSLFDYHIPDEAQERELEIDHNQRQEEAS